MEYDFDAECDDAWIPYLERVVIRRDGEVTAEWGGVGGGEKKKMRKRLRLERKTWKIKCGK